MRRLVNVHGLTPVERRALYDGQRWQPLVFASGSFVNYGSGFGSCAYRKVGDMVQLRGLARLTGSIGVSGVITNLPVGYRPAANQRALFNQRVAMNGVETHGRVDIQANGDVVMFTLGSATANNDYVSLEGIQFFTSTP